MAVTSSALGGSGLFLLLGCVCCVVFGAKSSRDRFTSRMLGVGMERVDMMPYIEHEKRIEGPRQGLFRGDVPRPASAAASAARPAPSFSFTLPDRRRIAFERVAQ